MRRLLTGYALYFNRRHRRSGHLFQNGYKSILCQEDAYLLELVRYIHLNPLRAKLINDFTALQSYPFCGHSAIMGEVDREWQDTDFILPLLKISPADVLTGGKKSQTVVARSLLCFWSSCELG